MKKKTLLLGIILALLTFTLTGCIPGDGTYRAARPAGFLWGVWHGWIAPISLIIGIFDKNIRIYEVVNIGWWYDLGYYAAVISGFGGLSLFRRKRSERHDR